MSEPKHAPLPDPMIDEVRAIRESILREFDYDLRKYFDHLRDLEKQYADRIATPPPPDVSRRP